MYTFPSYVKLAALALLPLSFVACDDDDVDVVETNSISERIAADDRFSTLESLLEAQNLDDVLDGDSQQFTLFAPVNNAFTGVDVSGLTDAQVSNILLYHVLGAEIKSSAIQDGYTVTNTATAQKGPNGTDLSLVIVKDQSDNITINGAGIVEADIDEDNGVIHAIDKVLMPPSVVDHATNLADFSSLVSALTAASGDLVGVLSGDGPFTVFAPVNAAFAGTTADDNLNASELNKVLTYHVVPGNILSTDITASTMVTTVNGEMLTVAPITGGGVQITDARGNTSRVVVPNVQGTNGVVHAIDGVLLPNEL